MTLLLFLAGTLSFQPADLSLPEDEMVRVFGAGETLEWSVWQPSIRRSGNSAQATIQINHFRRAQLRGRDEVHVAVDCRRQLYRATALERHDRDGLIERRVLSEAEFPMTIAQPRTGPAAVVRRICGGAESYEDSMNARLRASPN